MAVVMLAGVGPDLRKVVVDALVDEGVSVLDGASDLPMLALRSDPIALVVLGKSVENPVETAESLGIRRSQAAVLIVVPPDRAAEIRKRVRFSPVISADVRCVRSDRLEEVAEKVRAMTRKAHRRRRFSEVLPQLQEQFPAKASEERAVYLDTLLDHAPLGVIILDAEARAIDLNTEAERFLTVAGSTAQSRPLSELLPQGVRGDFERLLQDIHPETEESPSFRTSWPRAGPEMHVEVIAVPCARRKDAGTMLILRDVTADVKAEQAEWNLREQRAVSRALESQAVQLRRLNDELASRNEELQQFAYVASHDLQEPLRKIASFSDLLIMEAAEMLDENGRYYLDRIQAAALRMSELINSLLRLSRAGTTAIHAEEIDLNEVVQHVLSDLALPIRESDAEIHVDDLPGVGGDPGQIRQLFQNLIANALKFRKPGERASIRVFAEPEAATSSNGRPLHRITVSDKGIGFDDQFAERIFSPFQRLHRSDEYPGTGMGLAICSRIVQRHGGQIQVESRPGEGASFTVEIPSS